MLGAPAGDLQVAKGLRVDREEGRRRAVLGAHVAEGRAVGNGEGRQPIATELDELVDHAVLAQHLGQREDEVGGGGSRSQRAREANADDDRWRQVGRLTQHRGLGLDPAHAPTQHPKAVDHCRVRVGPHQRVGDRDLAAVQLADLHDLRDMFQIHLVADTHAWGHQREVVEGLLRPPQQ